MPQLADRRVCTTTGKGKETMPSTSTTRRSSVSAVGSSNGSVSTPANLNSRSASSNAKSKPQIITPKIQESQLGEAIQFRGQILPEFKELGQPDLVHISKYERSMKQEIGEYHYVTGINTSSVIQPFMYIQTIQLNDKELATNKHMKVGTYCCYNIFSRGDLRIRCQFPGSASPMVQFVPSNKSKITIQITDDEKSRKLHKETYVSSLIRAILFADSPDRQLPGMCKFNPIQSTKDSKEAIVLLCHFLDRGPETGCLDIYNRPSLINNHLVDALLKLLSITKYYDIAIKEIENLMSAMKLNLNVLIVKILLLKSEYAKAVRLMHDCLIRIPRDGWMLNEQALFLINQNRPDLALLPAMKSVECLPSEFVCWKNLILVYILQNDLKNALLALNSSPMYVNKRKDIYSALKPSNFEFPFPLEGKIENVWKDCETFGCISGPGGIVEFSSNAEVSKTNKYRLKVYDEMKLNYTFKEAYDLLALMTKKCGWSELLKLRSKIFVMEDEYNEVVNSEKIKENKSEDTKTIKDKSTISLTEISTRFKTKRLSEKWLDSLFLIFYENLKNVLIYQNELNANPDIQFCPLEWELVADECFRVHYFKESIVAYETCINKRFSVFAALKLLNHFLSYTTNERAFDALNGEDESSAKLDEDFILNICCKLISWSARFYSEFPLICFQALATLINLPDSDATVVKSKLEYKLTEIEQQQQQKRMDMTTSDKAVYREMDNSQGVMALVDRYISWLQQFDQEEFSF